jgi:hypothetical protein
MGLSDAICKFFEQTHTFDSICLEFARKKFAGYEGARRSSLQSEKQLADSQVRTTHVQTTVDDRLRTSAGPLMGIEVTEIEQRCERKKCGSCHLHNRAKAAFHHR